MKRQNNPAEGARSASGFEMLKSFSLPIILGVALATLGCEDKRRGSGGAHVGTTQKRDPSDIPQPEKVQAVPPEGTIAKETASENASAKGPAEGALPQKYAELTTLWGLGKIHDLGPAGPTTATDHGVYFVTRDDRLLLSAFDGKDGFIPIELDKSFFAKYGRGPSLSPTHAYWVSENSRLMRAPLKGGKPEVLFNKARIGTRTSVVTVVGRDIVTFIAEIGEDPLAYVWASRGSGKPDLLRMTPEGTTATSVALVEGAPHPRAIVLAGRFGMSPVHVRRIRVTARRITLEPDEVVWVGPGSHVLTEIHALTRTGDQTVAFLPTAKNFDDFGLAQLSIGPDPEVLDEPSWYIYPNGLDPAPVATSRFCGKPYVLFARPTEARPRSPQELHLSPIVSGPPQNGEVVARSRAFNDLSLSGTRSGAIASWTADRRTWGMVLTCPKK